jgi:ribosome-interacting GTPase 1
MCSLAGSDNFAAVHQCVLLLECVPLQGATVLRECVLLQVATILREYKIQHAEVILKEDCTEDDFIDVLEGIFFIFFI